MPSPYPEDFSIIDALDAEMRQAVEAVQEAQEATRELPALLMNTSMDPQTFGKAEEIMGELYRRERLLHALNDIRDLPPSAWVGELTARLVVISTGGGHPAPPPVLRVALEQVAQDILTIRNRFHGLVAPGFRVALTFSESDVDDFLTTNDLADTPENRANMRGAIEAAIESEGIMSDIREQVADGIESDRADDPTAWEMAS